MPKNHICLISEQPIPNLLPLLLAKPDKAVFPVSPQQITNQAERLKKVLKPRGIQIETREIAAYDFEQTLTVCQGLLAETYPASLTLNVTGGTKIAALAALRDDGKRGEKDGRTGRCLLVMDHRQSRWSMTFPPLLGKN